MWVFSSFIELIIGWPSGGGVPARVPHRAPGRGWRPGQGADAICLGHDFRGLGFSTWRRNQCTVYIRGHQSWTTLVDVERRMVELRCSSKAILHVVGSYTRMLADP